MTRPDMTLRDYFAGQALAALDGVSPLASGAVSTAAYKIADAMLKEKQRTENEERGPWRCPLHGTLDVAVRPPNYHMCPKCGGWWRGEFFVGGKE